MGAIKITELGAKGMAEMGTAVAAGGVIVGIAVFVATFGLSKVSAIRRIDVQNE